MTRHECYGGRRGHCTNPPVWAVKQAGDPDHTATLACGVHLHFAADEITGGEQMDLGLRRIRTDER